MSERAPGFYKYKSAEPFPEHGLLMWHCCGVCSKEGMNTELRPIEVEFHLLKEHGVDLESYATEYGDRWPGTETSSIAQWHPG